MLAARELTDDLIALTANIDVQVVQGNKTVEMRNAGVHKGLASQIWLLKNSFDFILAIGDDLTDEDLFTVLPGRAYSIRVGNRPTRARFHLQGPEGVMQLLETLDAEYLKSFLLKPEQAVTRHAPMTAEAIGERGPNDESGSFHRSLAR